MIGKQSEQIQMVILDIDSMIPDTHLLRRIKNCVNFDFIYEKAAPYYSPVGRKSIDPVVLIKMLLIGYLYEPTVIVISLIMPISKLNIIGTNPIT